MVKVVTWFIFNIWLMQIISLEYIQYFLKIYSFCILWAFYSEWKGDIKGTKAIRRTVTNVGSPQMPFIQQWPMVHAPEGLDVKVIPNKLVFTQGVKSMSHEVTFYGKEASDGYNFGSLTWIDGRHHVHTVFAVYVE